MQSVIKLYEMEQEKARRERRLKKFPKSISQWKPQGGKLEAWAEEVLTALHTGLHSTAVVFLQHCSAAKQHSREYLYVSKQHPSKRGSIVYFTKETRGKKFGEIRQIFKHSFASKDYVWVALNTFKGVQFDTKNGLWWAENAIDQRMVILLTNVSPPLTVATEDSTTWFLDVQAFNL